MNKFVRLACLAAVMPAWALGQETPQDAPPAREAQPAAEEKVVPQVTVAGTRNNETDQRRLSTAAKTVIGREELDRNGDNSIADVLKRLPGVTLGGAPGRGGRVQMRGMGNYTQMLVNGERPPPGFSLDSLPPDQVERIEVMRGPVAEHSTQAIAGTINIVLREGYRQKDRTLRISDSVEQGRHDTNLSITVPGQKGKLTWLLTGSAMANRRLAESRTRNLDIADSGDVTRDELTTSASSTRTVGLHLSPRLDYRFDNGDTLSWQQFLASHRSKGASTNDVAQATGSVPPEYDHLDGRTESTGVFTRGFGNWVHKMDKGAKLDVKFGFGGGRMENENRRQGYSGGVQAQDWVDDTSSRSRSANTSGKYTSPLGEGHLLAAGWDLEAQHTTQARVSLLNGEEQFAGSGDDTDADTRRVAAFIQDEWDVSKRFSTYLGLRWEGIRTSSAGTVADVSNTTSVWSPVLHGVWRIPGREKDQVRASLTRSYKAPNTGELLATPSFSNRNSATTPDSRGNPDLKPELATGIDIAYERYIGRSGVLSASVFARQIDQLIRRRTTLEQTPQGERWVTMPVNVGKADTRGIELEAKFRLADVMKDAPDIDLRSNYSHFWSHVDGIPGPDNRLDQQARASANLGFDYRMKSRPLTLGASVNWTPATEYQISANERVSTGERRQFEAYGLWKFKGGNQVRLFANNLGAYDYLTGRRVTVPGTTYLSDSSMRTYTTLGVRFETKL